MIVCLARKRSRASVGVLCLLWFRSVVFAPSVQRPPIAASYFIPFRVSTSDISRKALSGMSEDGKTLTVQRSGC